MSSWCSISLHSSKIGGRSQIAQNSWVRMSRRMGTSSTTQMAEILGKHWSSCGTSRTKLHMDTHLQASCGKDSSRTFYWYSDRKRYRIGNVFLFTENKDYSYRKTCMTSKWQEESRKWPQCGRNWWILSTVENQHHFLIAYMWMHSTWMQTARNYCWRVQKNVRITNVCWGNWKIHAKTVAWSYDMGGHAPKCVERYCELANKKTEQFYKVSTPCLDDHHSRKEELESVGELSKVSSQIVLKCLFLAWIGRLDVLWSVNKLARAGTKWTRAWDRRSARLISYIHHTNDYRQFCHVGNSAQHYRFGLFQGSDFAGDLDDSKSTSGRILCIFGSWTFVPISWMCKKQTSVSHSSTEAEVISLDAGLRMDGLSAVDLWDTVIEVLRSTNNTAKPRRLAQGNLCGTGDHSTNKTKTKTPTEKNKRDVGKCQTWITYPRTHILLKASLTCLFLKRMKPWLRCYQRTKSTDETPVQNPQSCVRLVVRQNPFGPQHPKSYMLTPRTNLRTCWPKVLSRVMNGIIFFICSTSAISRCFPGAIFSRTESRAPCRRELRQGSSKKDLRSRYQGQHVWCQETSWAQCKPLLDIRVLHAAPGIKSWVGILFSLAQGNLRGTGSRTQQRILKSGRKKIIRFLAQGNVCGVVCVCERSVGAGRPVQVFENQLARTQLDYHHMQISDDQYLEKVFENLRQKLNLSEDAEIFNQKTNVLIWGFFSFQQRCRPHCILGNITMRISFSTGTPISKSSRRCSTSRRGWSWNRTSRFWMFPRWNGHSLHGWDSLCYMTQLSSGRKQKYTSTQIRSYVWERFTSIQKQTQNGKINFNISNLPASSKTYLESMENHLSSSGIFSQDIQH